MAEKTIQVAFRLPETLVARLDREAERRQEESPGLKVTRADVVRMLLIAALDEREEAQAPKPRKGRER